MKYAEILESSGEATPYLTKNMQIEHAEIVYLISKTLAKMCQYMENIKTFAVRRYISSNHVCITIRTSKQKTKNQFFIIKCRYGNKFQLHYLQSYHD